jgi:hypothetical protein
VPKLVSDRTAARITALLNAHERASGPAGASPARTWAFVRCESATAVGGSNVLDQCYPARLLRVFTRTLLPDAELHARGVLLTLVGDDGEPAEPVAGRVYVALLGGEVPSDGSGSLNGRTYSY